MTGLEWVPFKIEKYLKKTMHLTTRQHGAYLLLLIRYWVDGPLPENDAELMATTKLSPREWRMDRHVLLAFFEKQDGRLLHKRADEERNQAERRVRSATKNANARHWNDDGSPKNDRHTRAGLTPTPTSTESPSGLSSADKPRVSEGDLKYRIFGQGLEWLSERSGKPVEKLRPMMGRWCSNHGDNAVLDAMQRAARESPIDPIAWIERAMQPKEPKFSPGLAAVFKIMKERDEYTIDGIVDQLPALGGPNGRSH